MGVAQEKPKRKSFRIIAYHEGGKGKQPPAKRRNLIPPFSSRLTAALMVCDGGERGNNEKQKSGAA